MNEIYEHDADVMIVTTIGKGRQKRVHAQSVGKESVGEGIEAMVEAS